MVELDVIEEHEVFGTRNLLVGEGAAIEGNLHGLACILGEVDILREELALVIEVVVVELTLYVG